MNEHQMQSPEVGGPFPYISAPVQLRWPRSHPCRPMDKKGSSTLLNLFPDNRARGSRKPKTGNNHENKTHGLRDSR